MSSVPPAAPAPPAARPPTLPLAALVLALVPCCPPVPMLGAVLGLMAHARLRRAGGPVRAMRTALLAAAIGSGNTVVSFGLVQYVARVQHDAQVAAIETQLRDLFAADRTAPAWSSAVRPPDAATLASFRAEVAERLGAFDRLEIVSETVGGSWMSPRLEIAGTLRFERGDRLGAIWVEVAVSAGSFSARPRLLGVRLELEPGTVRTLGRVGEG